MKQRVEALIVVEGITDVAFLQSFLDADFITTNGSDVPRETIEYIKQAKLTRDVIILTDPDAPGKRIRDILDQEIPGLRHAFINKEEAIKKNKVGVAESNKDAVLEALEFAFSTTRSKEGNLTMNDLYELGLSGNANASKKRENLSKTLHLGHGNAKTILKRMNALGLTKEQIEEALEHE